MARKRNRSGHTYYTDPNLSADENYAAQIQEWIYISVRDNLTPNLGSTIAQRIAEAAANSAQKKYMEFAKRSRR